MGNAQALSLGPGTLRVANIGTTEPIDLVTAWPAGWVQCGYTFEGHVFSYQLELAAVEVAEELDVLLWVPTGRKGKVTFTLAELTASNLKRALNGGVMSTGAGFVTIEPPDFGTETSLMYGFESTDATERWVFRQCKSAGEIQISRKKGADKAGIPLELNLEKPAAARLFKAMMATPVRA